MTPVSGEGIESLQVQLVTLSTDGDFGSDELVGTYFCHAGILSVISISGFRLFRIPGLNLRILVQRIWLSSVQWISCDDSDIFPGSVYFGTPQVGFMVTRALR